MIVVPVNRHKIKNNPQNPSDTNPPLHIPNPPPLPNLSAHLQNLPEQPQNPLTHVPNPEQPQNPPTHVPNPIQPTNPPPQASNPMQPQNPPANPPNPMQPQAPQIQMPQLNWSYFKPEFSGKPEEDAIAHLLRTNDWMETHNFPEETKVQRFCLTLTGEARLWYETLRSIEVDWIGLQECFRQQYSKFGNTREQLFHVWQSFQYDENTDTIDTYICKIKQVAALLNYGEPQILELFKNTLPSKLYWILFPINNLRDAVDATKRVLTKEKLDKQLSGQAGAATPFMQVKDVLHSNKKVSFNVHDPIKEQLENLTSLVYNMSMQKEENNRGNLSLKSIQREVGDKTDKVLVTEIGVEYLIVTDKDKILDPTIGDSCKIDNVEMDNRRESYRHQNYSRNDSRDRGRQNFRKF